MTKMKFKVLTALAVLISGFAYFVLGQGYWALAFLAVFTLATRFTKEYSNVGMAAQALLVFCGISIAINEVGINYPYSLVIILTGLIGLIFFEGPEWGLFRLGFGKTHLFFRLSLVFSVLLSIVICGAVYWNYGNVDNPVPLDWPIDAVLILGLGFALYMAIMNEMIFRSVLFQRIQTAASAGVANFLQALFFGFMWYKVPVTNGVPGILLGTTFGLALGYLTQKSGSIYLAMFVHFVVIFILFIELTLLGKL